jgi:predicted flap endonuclease-1-like 5' DNA nuclease
MLRIQSGLIRSASERLPALRVKVPRKKTRVLSTFDWLLLVVLLAGILVWRRALQRHEPEVIYSEPQPPDTSEAPLEVPQEQTPAPVPQATYSFGGSIEKLEPEPLTEDYAHIMGAIGETGPGAPEGATPGLVQAPESGPVGADDLSVIEGIGPHISGVLRRAGIMSFAALADTPVERLRSILRESGEPAFVDPGTWPAQARLAADGDWEGLGALKNELKAGRGQ